MFFNQNSQVSLTHINTEKVRLQSNETMHLVTLPKNIDSMDSVLKQFPHFKNLQKIKPIWMNGMIVKAPLFEDALIASAFITKVKDEIDSTVDQTKYTSDVNYFKCTVSPFDLNNEDDDFDEWDTDDFDALDEEDADDFWDTDDVFAPGKGSFDFLDSDDAIIYPEPEKFEAGMSLCSVHEEVIGHLYDNDSNLIAVPIISLSTFLNVNRKIVDNATDDERLHSLFLENFWANEGFPLIIQNDMGPLKYNYELNSIHYFTKNTNQFIVLISTDEEDLCSVTSFEKKLFFEADYEYTSIELPRMDYYIKAMEKMVESFQLELDYDVDSEAIINKLKEFRGTNFAGVEDIERLVYKAFRYVPSDALVIDDFQFNAVFTMGCNVFK